MTWKDPNFDLPKTQSVLLCGVTSTWTGCRETKRAGFLDVARSWQQHQHHLTLVLLSAATVARKGITEAAAPCLINITGTTTNPAGQIKSRLRTFACEVTTGTTSHSRGRLSNAGSPEDVSRDHCKTKALGNAENTKLSESRQHYSMGLPEILESPHHRSVFLGSGYSCSIIYLLGLLGENISWDCRIIVDRLGLLDHRFWGR